MTRPPTLLPDSHLASADNPAMRAIEAWHAEGRVELFDGARHPEPVAPRPEEEELRRLLFPLGTPPRSNSPTVDSTPQCPTALTTDADREQQLAAMKLLATAIEHRLEFLLTEDETFHRCEDALSERYEIHVLRPEDFVALFQIAE